VGNVLPLLPSPSFPPPPKKKKPQRAIKLTVGTRHAALGSGILFAYPEIATIAGVQGLVVYSLSSALPLLVFAFLGPIIRRKCPEGFVLTEWTRQRYGAITALYLSALTYDEWILAPAMLTVFRLITLFLYMVAELSALQQIVNTLTGLNGLPVVIVECVVTTIYTSLGGFKVSFITDNVQGAMVVLLIIIGVITVGAKTTIDRSLVESSGLLDASLLGWQLIYILPVAILTNDFFLSGFWMRTFASKTDKDLWIGVSIATIVVAIILTLVGVSGLLAVWSNALKDAQTDGSVAFFLLLDQLPAWVVGIVLVMVVCLSTAAFDSFQSAMVSTGSNDIFRNKLNFWFIRAAVVLVIVPTVVVALKSPSVLRIFLISDLVSASSIPVLVIGLSDRCWWWRGFEVVVGGLGGILTVFLFGLVYYDGDARMAGNLILLEDGLYAEDWSAFGRSISLSHPLLATDRRQERLSLHPSEVCCGAWELSCSASPFNSFWRRYEETDSQPWIDLLLRLQLRHLPQEAQLPKTKPFPSADGIMVIIRTSFSEARCTYAKASGPHTGGRLMIGSRRRG
jgi:Na+/proline symporter